MTARGQGSALLNWRNWSLPTKLAAVVLVPVVFAIALGVGQIRWQVDQADEYRRVSQVLDAVDRAEPLIASLQSERNRGVQFLTGQLADPRLAEAAAAAGTDPERSEDVIPTDQAITDLTAVIQGSGNYSPVVLNQFAELQRAMADLPALRQRVETRQIDTPATIDGYSKLISATLSLDRALTSSVGEQTLSSTASAIQDMMALTEEVRIQQAWVLTGITQGRLGPQAQQNLLGSRVRLLSKITETRSTIAAHWQQRLDSTLVSPEILGRNALLDRLMQETSGRGGISVSPQQWNQASDDSVTLIDGGHDDLSADVRASADQLADHASDSAGWDSVLLLSALVAAAAVITMITRQLLGSLRTLRISALDAAEYDLPAAVEAIRRGRGEQAQVPPVPIETTEDIGQLARAFDGVNEQALKLATEQAELRHSYSEVFVGVSRRSQSLLERQLRLFEELERDEEDPDQLSRLFALDHLATRMRRNNENLMVLSGSDLARRFTKPTDLSDVLRASVSEIEQYARVTVQQLPSLQLRGNTASDLVRLVAELLDNAANFSAPDTMVTVSGYQAGDNTVVLDVLDQGIGMNEQELAVANHLLSSAAEHEMGTSRRMGLYVAGRLAARHGIGIELHGGPEVEGLRATVLIPAEHVVSVTPGPGALPTQVNTAHANGRSGVNGHSRTNMLPFNGGFDGQLGTAGFTTEIPGYDDQPARGAFDEPARGAFDEPVAGDSAFGGAQYGDPQYSESQYSESQYGEPQYGEPQYGEPQYGEPQYGEPQYGSQFGESRAVDSGFGVSPVQQNNRQRAESPWIEPTPSVSTSGAPAPGTPAMGTPAPGASVTASGTSLFEPLSWHEPADATVPPFAWSGPDEQAQGHAEQAYTDQSYPEHSYPGQSFSTQNYSGQDYAGGPYAEQDYRDAAPEPVPDKRVEQSTQWFLPASENPALRDLDENSEFSWPGEEVSALFPANRAFLPPEPLVEDSPTSAGLPRRKPRGGQPDAGNQSASNGVQFDSVGTGESTSFFDTRSANDTGHYGGNESGSVNDFADDLDRGAGQDQFGYGGVGYASQTGEQAWAAQTPEAQAWDFASDQAHAVTDASTGGVTAAGLPRRTPKANLVPGSAAKPQPSPRQRDYQRDADVLRGRLSSFQSGVSKGRHHMTDDD